MLSYVYNQNELDSDDSSNNEEIISEEEYNHDELGSDDSLNNEEIRRERIENELKDVFEIMKVFSTRIYRCSELKRVWENNPRPESPSEYYIYIFNGGNDLYLKRGREIKLTMEVYDNVLEVRNNFADEEYYIFKLSNNGEYFLRNLSMRYDMREKSFSSFEQLLEYLRDILSIRDGDLSDDDTDDGFISD